jgi:peptidoglycan/LPS O-acetylase OafA/YrhL
MLLPAIDGFRGFAVLLVVVTHVHVWTGMPQFGNQTLTRIIAGGVIDTFFIISGFVLFLPAVLGQGSMGDLRSFALRRAARIVPLYYVSLAAFVLLQRWLIPAETPIDLPFQTSGGTISLVMHLLFAQNFVLLLPQHIGFGNGVVWTLPLEVVFYCLLPVVALRFYRHPFFMLGAAFAATALWKLAVADLPVWLGWLGLKQISDERIAFLKLALTHAPSYFGQFALGMTAAWIFVKYRHWSTTPVARRVALAVQLVAAIFVLKGVLAQGANRLAGYPDELTLKTTSLSFWFTVLILVTLFAPVWAQWPATNRLIRGLGVISYGVYLFHLLFIRFAIVTLGYRTDGTPEAFLEMLAFVTAGSVIAGWLSYVLVERPVRRWAVRSSRRSKQRRQGLEPLPAETG